MFLSFHIDLLEGVILEISVNTGGFSTQLLAFFQSITPAVHASVNFSPD